MRTLKYHQAILEATSQMMEKDEGVFVMGQGVASPKGAYGTTTGLLERFGEERVFDIPSSENSMTGIAIGSAIQGLRPILSFERVDYFIMALDQLINNGAKWHYMYGNQMTVPLVIRLVIGRGWGQGPQHSQSLQSIFAHIPGIKVVMPANPADAKGLLNSAIKDPNPTVFLEHRWLHKTQGEVAEEPYEIPFGKAKVIQEGSDITIAALSYSVLEGMRATTHLKKEGISAELIDLRSVKPLDKEAILKSVRKTCRLLVLDPDWKTSGFAAEVIATVTEEAFSTLTAPPARVTYPDRHIASSWALSNHYYPSHKMISMEVYKMLKMPSKAQAILHELLEYRNEAPLDVPEAHN